MRLLAPLLALGVLAATAAMAQVVPAPATAPPPAAAKAPATPATPPAPTNTTLNAANAGSSACVRCDNVPTNSCPECPTGQVCVYVARTCGHCARKECRAAEAVGVTAADSATAVDGAGNTTLFIIIGCCAAGTIVVLAGIGLVVRQRKRQRLARGATRGAADPKGPSLDDPEVCIDESDLLDDLGEDPLGSHVRVKSSAYSHHGVSMGPGPSVFDPPMMSNVHAQMRASNVSSIFSMGESPPAARGASMLAPPGAAALASAPKPKKVGQLRIDTNLAAGGARSKDSLDRARNATQDLRTHLLSDPLAPAADNDMALLQQRAGAAPVLTRANSDSLLPPISPSMARFSMASFSNALESGKGVRPLSSAGGAPLSPVPAHPPPALPLTAVTVASGSSMDAGEAQRVDEWWRASVNARSTLYDELGRPVSLAYSDVSSNAESVVQVASARVMGTSVATGGLQPVVGSVQQIRSSRMMLGQPAGPRDGGNHAAQSAYLALAARRSESAPAEADPPTGSIYGMM